MYQAYCQRIGPPKTAFFIPDPWRYNYDPRDANTELSPDPIGLKYLDDGTVRSQEEILQHPVVIHGGGHSNDNIYELADLIRLKEDKNEAKDPATNIPYRLQDLNPVRYDGMQNYQATVDILRALRWRGHEPWRGLPEPDHPDAPPVGAERFNPRNRNPFLIRNADPEPQALQLEARRDRRSSEARKPVEGDLDLGREILKLIIAENGFNGVPIPRDVFLARFRGLVQERGVRFTRTGYILSKLTEFINHLLERQNRDEAFIVYYSRGSNARYVIYPPLTAQDMDNGRAVIQRILDKFNVKQYLKRNTFNSKFLEEAQQTTPQRLNFSFHLDGENAEMLNYFINMLLQGEDPDRIRGNMGGVYLHWPETENRRRRFRPGSSMDGSGGGGDDDEDDDNEDDDDNDDDDDRGGDNSDEDGPPRRRKRNSGIEKKRKLRELAGEFMGQLGVNGGDIFDASEFTVRFLAFIRTHGYQDMQATQKQLQDALKRYVAFTISDDDRMDQRYAIIKEMASDATIERALTDYFTNHRYTADSKNTLQKKVYEYFRSSDINVDYNRLLEILKARFKNRAYRRGEQGMDVGYEIPPDGQLGRGAGGTSPQVLREALVAFVRQIPSPVTYEDINSVLLVFFQFCRHGIHTMFRSINEGTFSQDQIERELEAMAAAPDSGVQTIRTGDGGTRYKLGFVRQMVNEDEDLLKGIIQSFIFDNFGDAQRHVFDNWGSLRASFEEYIARNAELQGVTSMYSWQDNIIPLWQHPDIQNLGVTVRNSVSASGGMGGIPSEQIIIDISHFF